MPSYMNLPRPYLLFLGGVTDASYAKTAFGLRDWAFADCVGEFAFPSATVTTGLPRLSFREARARGAQSLVIGIANMGGAVEPVWIPSLVDALESGLDLVGGMHLRLKDDHAIAQAAARCGRRLFDVRQPPNAIPVGTGRRRAGRRLLTVGTDCAVGKKYTALTLAREFRKLGVDATFRATGQTGILIAGEGIPIDAVVSDFVAGAAEMLTPDAPSTHWDVVEGQGSLFHPSYAGVSLGLLHGTQPDVIVLCHELGRKEVKGLRDYPLPTLREAIELNLTLARRTNPRVRCAGVSLNTSRLHHSEAREALVEHGANLGLPVADPVRGGVELDQLVAACLV